MDKRHTSMKNSPSSTRRRLLARLGAVVCLGLAAASTWLAIIDWQTASAQNTITAQQIRWMSGTPASAPALTIDQQYRPSGALLDLAAQSHMLTATPDLTQAEHFTRQALAKSPARADAWARLAAIDVQRHGQLTPTGREAFKRSFGAAPFGDQDFQKWRLQFAVIHWAQLDNQARNAALDQIAALTYYEGHADRYWVLSYIDTLPESPAKTALTSALNTALAAAQ